MGKHSAGSHTFSAASAPGTRSADDVTVKRPSRIPGLGDITLVAQPTYLFTYRGQNYAANWDRRANNWVVSWVRDTDRELIVMAVRPTLEQAVRDAMDDVDQLSGALGQR